jgi:RNA polymerase sigma factor (sigma-70 family)
MFQQTGFSDKTLIDNCLKNDRKAQKALYDKYKDSMFTISIRLSNNYDDAADALQEAFIEVFRDLENFEYRSTLGAWIKTIVIRKALRKQRTNFCFDPIDNELINQTIEWKDCFTAEYLENAIQSLPGGTKAVFLLVAVEGYKHREVAEILNISEGTSKSQLNYAKVLLKQRLLEFEHD